jgi:hypothetical protein
VRFEVPALELAEEPRILPTTTRPSKAKETDMVSSRRTAQWKWLAALVVAVVLTGVGVAAQGQEGLRELVEKVLSLLTSIQSDVTAIKSDTAAGTAAAQSTTRFTGKAIFRAGVLDCAAVNVVAEPRNILIQLISGSTGVVATQDSGSIPTAPGASRSAGIASSFATGSFYCKFTVLNGIGSDIRGNLLIGANLVNDTTLLAIAAE